jgi:hypothetical protein
MRRRSIQGMARSHTAAMMIAGQLIALAPGFPAWASDVKSQRAHEGDYLRECPEHGKGFVKKPDTTWCLRLGGRARADTSIDSASGFFKEGSVTEARVSVDARSTTDYGLLRGFVRYTQDTNGKSKLESFVQFAGVTAGRTTSFFDFYGDDLNWRSIAGSDVTANVLAYTLVGQAGLTATLSLEDRHDRAIGLNALAAQTNGSSMWIDSLAIATQPFAGERLPAAVANIRIDADWGSAQLSGAIQPLRSIPCLTQPSACQMAVSASPAYALQAGIQFNLPSLAEGDSLTLQTAYARGALSYLGVGNVPDSVGSLTFNSADADLFVVGGSAAFANLLAARGTSTLAAFLHYWSPSVRQAVFGSFLWLNNPRIGYPWGQTLTLGRPDARLLQLGTNLVWSPVAQLDIGVEVGYERGNTSFPLLTYVNYTGPLSRAATQVYAMTRVQRLF